MVVFDCVEHYPNDIDQLPLPLGMVATSRKENELKVNHWAAARDSALCLLARTMADIGTPPKVKDLHELLASETCLE